MGFAVAFLNMLLIYQRIVDLPWQYESISNKLLVNPNRNLGLSHRLKRNPIWSTFQCILPFSWCYFLLKTKNLLLHWKSNVNLLYILEIVIYACGTAVLTFVMSTLYALERNPSYFISFIEEIFKYAKVKYLGFPNSKRPPSIPELLGYMVAFGYLFIPISGAAFPFLFNFDPFAYIFTDLIPVGPRKIIASVSYGASAACYAVACACLQQFVLAACHIFEKETQRNLQLSKQYCNIQGRLSQQSLFKTCTLRHKIVQLMMTVSNENEMKVYVPVLAGVGIVFSVFANFGVLAMYRSEEQYILLLMGVCMLATVYGLILFICLHASLPMVYTERLISVWKTKLVGKQERRLLKSMKRFGFHLGIFFEAKQRTALDIMETILCYTLSLLVSL